MIDRISLGVPKLELAWLEWLADRFSFERSQAFLVESHEYVNSRLWIEINLICRIGTE